MKSMHPLYLSTEKKQKELKRIRAAIARNRKRIGPGTLLAGAEKEAVVMRLDALAIELNCVTMAKEID